MYDQIARYYQLTHADLDEDISLWGELIAECGTHVMELGCGSGRLLPHLAKRAQFVHGVDNSSTMLALAKEACKSLPISIQERISLTKADMSQLSLPWAEGTFHLIGVPYNTFLHLDTVAATQTLRNIKPYFAENGRLFIDIINPFYIAETPSDPTYLLENKFHVPETNETVLQFATNRLDYERQKLQITWVFDASPADGGRVKRTISTMNYHYRYPHQLQLLLQDTGYQLVNQFGSYDRSPFSEKSPRLLLLAEPVC